MPERYIVTRSGARVSAYAGVPTLGDLVLNHCRTPMFGGHTNLPYTVAHHCLSAAELALPQAGPRVAMYTLLHEAEVATYGEVPGPMKFLELRTREKDNRHRFLASVGMPLPTPDEWEQVERYDKLEQRASTVWAYLAEDVHEAVWESASKIEQAHAVETTLRNYKKFLPKDNLQRDSPLADEFIGQFNALCTVLDIPPYEGR